MNSNDLALMAEERPTAAATLPRNFQFREYAEDDLPRTPEPQAGLEADLPQPQSPRPRYVIRRQKRRSTLNPRVESPEDEPIPSIEASEYQEPSLLSYIQQQNAVFREPSPGFLSVSQPRREMIPRTPSPQLTNSKKSWSFATPQEFGESISRPTSRLSISDTSDDSDRDSDDDMSYGGSCTSPESDIGSIVYHDKSNWPATRLTFEPESPLKNKTKGKLPSVQWTADMDNHLWACYLKYLNDPTVTPFKNWPGSAPPLGVCRRVAREAKKTWKGPKTVNPFENKTGELHRGNSSDTLMALKSGSNTPTETSKILPRWPKTTGSTRKRLRSICKRKTVIAPHYQRMLKSQTPEPFSSSRGTHRARFSSPALMSTRDVRVSLATSTSATMQRDGPLAQITKPSIRARSSSAIEWFNDPSVTWASPAPQPSSDEVMEHNASESEQAAPEVASSVPARLGSDPPPRLGSPFTYHTWTAGNAGQRPRRSKMPRPALGHASASVPRLRPPFEIHSTFPYPSANKRRAQNQLEEDVSPGGSSRRHSLPREADDVFAPIGTSQRRVRARGFSYGDALTQGRLPTLHTPAPNPGYNTIHRFTTPPPRDNASTPPPISSMRVLGSPFAGISTRPTRSRRVSPSPIGMHGLETPAYPSIEETLNQPAQQ